MLRKLRGTRTIFVAARLPQTKERLAKWAQADDDRRWDREQTDYARRLRELKLLTESVGDMIKKRDRRDRVQRRVDRIPMPLEVLSAQKATQKALQRPQEAPRISHGGPSSGQNALDLTQNAPSSTQIGPASTQIADDASAVYSALSAPSTDAHSYTGGLYTPEVELPPAITARLGLATQYLVTKTHQNWPLVLQQLAADGGFRDIPSAQVHQFIGLIPRKYLAHLVPQVQQLLADANIRAATPDLHAFISALSIGGTLSDADIASIEGFCAAIRTNNQGTLPRTTYELMITAHGKRGDIARINDYIADMRAAGIEPSLRTLSSVLAACVYKSRDHSQAVAVFDTLKFTGDPSTDAYQHIIVSHVNNGDVERALDLYQEMLAAQIAANQQIMVALARGCTLRPELRLKAWDFMFEIYNQRWEPLQASFEYMVYLSARDGDIALARALFRKLHASSAVSARSFGFLMLAYANAGAQDTPAITFHEKGRIFRRNILAEADFSAPQGTVPLPFLPVGEFASANEVLAESSAMWAHALMFAPQLLTSDCANSFLNIAARVGSLADFKDRFESFTVFDRTGLNEKRVENEAENEEMAEGDNTEEMAEMKKAEAAVSEGISSTNSFTIEEPSRASTVASHSITKSPLHGLPELQHAKVARTSLSYVIGLKAAGKAKDYSFAQQMWAERGLFRKTDAFRTLPRLEKDKLDFQFASCMVLCLTKMKLLDDALAILVSTEYQFKWTWAHLHELNQAAIKVGNDTITKTVRGVASRAQIKYAGKIRRKDYKRYVMERGY